MIPSPSRALLLCVAIFFAASAFGQSASGPLQITHGGVYSGNWTSNDLNTPAVTVNTEEPVIIRNSVISGRGVLIRILGSRAGATVTVEDVTGNALDPAVSGKPRGSFIQADAVHALVVRNCTINGAAYGVKTAGGSPTTLVISNNIGRNLEDRASDGHGGLLSSEPVMGHFVLLNHVVAAEGADIGWNQVIQDLGQTSTQDVVNIYESQGSAKNPIRVHDNYIQGASSAIPGRHYAGTALMTDGDASANAVPSAYVDFDRNQIVQTAGTGIAIAFGHDIQARSNRVVSCGVDKAGNTYAAGASSVVLWNYYNSPKFYNNVIQDTAGGMVSPASDHSLKPSNEFIKNVDKSSTNRIRSSHFTNPCLTASGQVNPDAEDQERARWRAKLAAAHQTVGDRHNLDR